MKSVVIISAVLLALVGFLGAAASPNPTDQLAGKFLVAIAAGFVLLAFYAPPKLTASIYFAAVALVIVAYSLPMSFWRSVGLAEEQPPKQQDSAPPNDDK